MLFQSLLTTILLMGTLNFRAEQPDVVPRDVIFANPVKTDPKISPDGDTIAYLAPNGNDILNIFVKSTDCSDDRQVTCEANDNIKSFGWSANDKFLLYSKDSGGDENFHIYVTNIETGETRDITPYDGIRANIISVGKEMSDSIIVAMNIKDRRFHDVYRINIIDGEVTLIEENDGSVASYLADNNQQVRAKVSMQVDGSQNIYVRETEATPWRHFFSWGAEDILSDIKCFNSTNDALIVKTSDEAMTARIVEVTLEGNVKTILFEDKKYDIENIVVDSKTKLLSAAYFYKERMVWLYSDKRFKDDISILRNYTRGDINIVSCDSNNKKWVVEYINDDRPIEYYFFDRTTKQNQRLFSQNDNIKFYRLSKTKPISFKARDGMTIYGYITLPVSESKNLPTVLLVHGGPWVRDIWKYSPMVQWLANRGYAVLQVNYRGSSGYGKNYFHAGRREWAGKMHSDLIDGKRWSIKNGYTDPSRVAVVGGSYGGYAALVSLTFTPMDFTCGVSFVGPSNLVTLLQSFPAYWRSSSVIFNLFVGDPNIDEKQLLDKSPITFVDRIQRPLLIAHGANDPRVKQCESDMIVDSMRRADKEVEYLLFKDEGHGFKKPCNQKKFTAAVEKFLHKHLDGIYEKEADEAMWQSF
jgi:dipeptidyl aminopeptidase/acylaminoacyl peptidase